MVMFILWLIFLVAGCVKGSIELIVVSGLYAVAVSVMFSNKYLKHIEQRLEKFVVHLRHDTSFNNGGDSDA